MWVCAKTVAKQRPEKHRLSFVSDASSVLPPFGLSSGSKTKDGIRMNPFCGLKPIGVGSSSLRPPDLKVGAIGRGNKSQSDPGVL
jgi:hypothetical protein